MYELDRFKNHPHQHSECYTSSTEEQKPTPIRIRLEDIHIHTEQALFIRLVLDTSHAMRRQSLPKQT